MSKTRLVRLLCLALLPGLAQGYPLDGGDDSGIRRLQGYQAAQHKTGGARLTPGQLWSSQRIDLRLAGYNGADFDALPPDPELSAALQAMLQERDPSYAMVVVDLSDPAHIRWAGLRPDLRQNPGSVGKLLCMAGLFQALAEAFPDINERQRVLTTTRVRAGDWIGNDEIHKVPRWDDASGRNHYSVLRGDDEFLLSEWLDHAISASANGAGTVIWREAMLIRHFGRNYPRPAEDNAQFFKHTAKKELAALASALVSEPLAAVGIDTANIRQGSFFTRNGKNKVPGSSSFATPRELARLLFRIEQGLLVDAWSSLQMKKYMYMTKRRYRYAYAPELARSAVFFKSGSLYSCRPEEGFRCGKYKGNKQNLMNSVAIVEGPEPGDPLYIAALMSDVLRFNSAWDHSRIAAATDKMLRTRKPQILKETASDKEMGEAGKSD
jgi:hypothetical protein